MSTFQSAQPVRDLLDRSASGNRGDALAPILRSITSVKPGATLHALTFCLSPTQEDAASIPKECAACYSKLYASNGSGSWELRLEGYKALELNALYERYKIQANAIETEPMSAGSLSQRGFVRNIFHIGQSIVATIPKPTTASQKIFADICRMPNKGNPVLLWEGDAPVVMVTMPNRKNFKESLNTLFGHCWNAVSGTSAGNRQQEGADGPVRIRLRDTAVTTFMLGYHDYQAQQPALFR